MVKEVSFEDVKVGTDLGTFEVTITPELVQSYAGSVDAAHHPWYLGNSPFGGPIAPVIVVEDLALGLLGKEFRIKAEGGGVHAKTSVEVLQPPLVGQKVSIQGTLVDKYIRREKYYFEYQFVARDGQGNVLVRGVHTNVSLPAGTAARVR
ncbi:MAG: hypothetical protein HYY00_03165 [Chloroflexi bacterium]|nr:hypothetical protein [Chloroflexota bacterium]